MRRSLLLVSGSLLLLVFGSSLVCSDDESASKKAGYVTQYMPRSEGDNLAYFMLYPWAGYCWCPEVFHGTIRLGYEFRESRHGKDIAKALLINDTLSFVGSSATPAATKTDLLADYFLLATDTKASISFDPKIKQNILTFDAFFDLPEFWPGVYLQIDAPLVHAQWNLHDSQGISQGHPKKANLSQTPFNPGYMLAVFTGETPSTFTQETLYYPLPKNNWYDALTGTQLPLVPVFTQGEKWGTESWDYGKFFGEKETDTKLASLNFDLGYNFYACQDYHVGAYIRLVAPSGTKFDERHAEYLFHPKIGEAHWKLGAGLTAHVELGSWCDCQHTMALYFQGYVVHPFAKNEVRVFDLVNKGPLSRYMLLKEFSDVTTLTGPADNQLTSVNTEATGRLVTAINYTTRHTRVKLDFQGEFALELAYQNACGLSAGVGYNFYGRSKERMKLSTTADLTIEARKLGFKGTSYTAMAGFNTISVLVPPATSDNFRIIDPVSPPDHAATERTVTSTESNATLYGGGTVDRSIEIRVEAPQPPGEPGMVYLTNWGTFPADGDPVVAAGNGNVIAHESGVGPVILDFAGTDILWGSERNAVGDEDQTGITNKPVLLKSTDLDLDSAACPRQISHKLYGHLDYAWADSWCAPYVRAGAEIECSAREDRQTMKAWAVFVNGGVNF
jgi:hypothetical protein